MVAFSVQNPKNFQDHHRRAELPALLSLQKEEGPNGRIYKTPTGKRYPSVTTVLSIKDTEHIIQWRNRVGHAEADAITRRASSRGTYIHSLFEEYLRNNLTEYNCSYDRDQMFRDLKEILDKRVDKVLMNEKSLYSDYMQTAGQVDLCAEFDKRLAIIDFKQANKPKQEEWINNYFLQTAAYCVMIEERTGIPVSKLVILIASPEGPQIFIKNRDDYIEEFMKIRIEFRKQRGL